MTKRKIFFRAIVAVVVIGALYRFFTSQPQQIFHLTGQTMGTIVYNVKYVKAAEAVKKAEIDSVLQALNQSLSTYIPDSEISRLNREGEIKKPSKLFVDVLYGSYRVHHATGGAFDPTVGPLVNAWGFGANKSINTPDSGTVDKLLRSVGMGKIKMSEQRIVMEKDMYLDFSAIAKGHAVDLLGAYLESKNVTNYMVEIGGEVRARGTNDRDQIWRIGIEDPMVAQGEQSRLAIVKLKDRSLATSGNYRNYYEKDGRIIAHTIDPRTGYNTDHRLLSASVFASDCMTADAYATAFMVLGIEESKAILLKSDLEAFLIFQKENGELGSFVTDGLKEFVDSNKVDE